MVLVDPYALKIIQSDDGLPASRLRPLSNNILAKLVEVFK